MATNLIRSAFSLTLLLLLTSQSLIAGPQVQHWTTSQGAKVLFVAAPDLPMLDIRVVLDAGSSRDGDLPGLSEITNGLLTDGAGEWDADQIAERVESVGAVIGLGALRDMAWLSVRTLTAEKSLNTSLDVLATLLSAPTFEADDLARNQQMMQASLRQEAQSPGSVGKKRFMATLYGDHPYAIHSGGTEESIPKLTRDKILAHFKQYYVAKNMVIALVGAVDRKQAEKIAERLTANVPAGEKPAAITAVADLTKATDITIDFPSSQSHILIGQPGMHRGDEDYFALYVGNHILGGSGLVSMLAEEVREERGLSYSVYSYFSPMRQNGPFLMGAQTKNAQAAETQALMRKILEDFIAKGPDEKLLERSIKNITGGFPLRISSNKKIIQYLTMLGFYDLPLDYMDTFADNIKQITAKRVQNAFKRRVHPDKLISVVTGQQP